MRDVLTQTHGKHKPNNYCYNHNKAIFRLFNKETSYELKCK